MYLSFSRFFLPTSHKIMNYWDNHNDIGFYNTKGEIFQIQNNSIQRISTFHPFLKEYKYITNSSLIDTISNSKTSSILEDKHKKVHFFWKDTTLYQTKLPNDVFFRMNYFGNYSIYINNTHHEKYIHNFKINEFLQYSSSFQNFLITVNNYNELNIYQYKEGKMEKRFYHLLFYKDIIKKIKVQKLNNYIYINILYRDNSYKSITLFHNENEDTFRYLHQNDIILRDEVIDFELKFPYVYILTKTNIQCYLLKTFDNFSQLIFKRYIHHNYNSIYYFQEKLYLSGEKYIDFFSIKKN